MNEFSVIILNSFIRHSGYFVLNGCQEKNVNTNKPKAKYTRIIMTNRKNTMLTSYSLIIT